MERVTIAFQNGNIDNFFCLHQGTVVAGKKVYFTLSPEFDVVNGEIETNVDYLITDGFEAWSDSRLAELLPKNRVCKLPRYSKVEQAVRFSNYCKENPTKVKSFIKPAIWNSNSSNITLSAMVPENIKVVIKPYHGARGIGQFLIDTSKIPFKIANNAIYNYISKTIEKQELFDELDKWSGSYSYSTAGEVSPDEGLQILREQGYFVQEYVPNVVKEYRLLTGLLNKNKVKVIYCQERSIRDSGAGFAQATGSTVSSLERTDIVDFKTIPHADEIEALVSNIIGPMNSVDLFITSDGKWGIFEHCNQFGMLGVPNDVAIKLHKDFIAALIA